MKRFYKLVTIEETQGGYQICLDGRAVKTKSGAVLIAPNQATADQVMCEWAGQGEEIIPDTMPFTQILNTMIDRVMVEREAMNLYVLKYLNTDLICYPAPEPESLAQLQEKLWSSYLRWFEDKFGVALKTTTGLVALSQDDAAHEKVAEFVGNLDHMRFTLLQLVTSVSGSLVLAMALLEKHVSAKEAFEACFIEEHYKDVLYDAEKYGQDPMTAKKQAAALRDLEAVERYLSFI
ncbi:MAG: ATP12 family chaperone protein [Alphaproteobacteria bacterium]